MCLSVDDEHFDFERITDYFDDKLSPNNDENDEIRSFLEQRILSKYTLYQTGMFQHNPSNLRFADFKQVLVHSLVDSPRFNKHRSSRLEILSGSMTSNVYLKSMNSGQTMWS